MRRHRRIDVLAVIVALACNSNAALAQSDLDDGRRALLTGSYIHGSWSAASYDQLWLAWGEPAKPADYSLRVRSRYGLHDAPYRNGRLPMGLREDKRRGTLAIDCLLCHGGSILGQSYVGLGNTTLDMQGLFEDLGKANGGSGRAPQPMSHVRGTVEAFNFTARLIAMRTFSFRTMFDDFTLLDYVCQDVPAWWLLKKKRTMYSNGAVSADSVRALMQFLLVPPTPHSALDGSEADFTRIRTYILSLVPPQYPLPIDAVLAQNGETLFNKHCAGCHGTYGAQWTYPNKIIEIDKIGTDRQLYDAMSRQWRRHYNNSWFAQPSASGGGGAYQAEETAGYQAPPLDGIWATAPYLHNGSVPTLYGILNSKARPKIFMRSFQTGAEDFDTRDVGWKIQAFSDAQTVADPRHHRQIYDTAAPGRNNGGHTYGDTLSETERRAILEYLKRM
jgi:mono/diheme cytochrome c family protein